jgi:polysaccharide pyruvyl transferase WcaK-like protein
VAAKPVRIGVFGHYGHLNLGDEAIIVALLDNIRRRRPDAELRAFSDNPEDTERRHRLPAFPVGPATFVPGVSDVPKARPDDARPQATGARTRLKRIPMLVHVIRGVRRLIGLAGAVRDELRFLPKALRWLRGLDLFIVAGSNQFLDNWGGPWGYPYRLLRWSVLSKLSGARVAFVSVGAGPIDRRLSRVLARTALLLSDYTSFRDEGSRRLIVFGGVGRGALVCPDLAHSLPLENGSDGDTTARAERAPRPTVAINPMPMFHGFYWCAPDQVKYRRYVDQLAALSVRLIREGYPLFFFGTDKDDEVTFHDVSKRLREELGEMAGGDRLFRRSHSVPELMATLASADVVVPTRFHGTVLALLAERPVLAICYYRKARELMEAMGQADYAMDLESFDAEDAWQRFRVLEENRAAEQQKIRKKNAEYRDALDRQYEYLLERLLPPGGR